LASHGYGYVKETYRMWSSHLVSLETSSEEVEKGKKPRQRRKKKEWNKNVKHLRMLRNIHLCFHFILQTYYLLKRSVL
jgi:hypothetical protein